MSDVSSDVTGTCRAQEILPGVPDWSTVHRPATDTLYTWPQRGEEWREYDLSEEQVEMFWRDGYITNIPVLTPAQCDLILADYKYFMGDKAAQHPGHAMLYEYHSNQSGDHDNVLMHALGHWRLTQLFHDLVFHPRIVAACSRLVIPEATCAVRFWHDQLFAKPARHGGVVAWHQDYSYWTRTQPQRHVTVHIALDDQTEENGGLKYIPGSHRWLRNGNPLPVLDFNFKDMEGIKTILTEDELRDFHPKLAGLKKGEASFHCSYTVHGSYANRSDAPRRAAVLNYFADGVCSDVDKELLVSADKKPDLNPLLFQGSDIPKGKKMGGSSFLLSTIQSGATSRLNE